MRVCFSYQIDCDSYLPYDLINTVPYLILNRMNKDCDCNTRHNSNEAETHKGMVAHARSDKVKRSRSRGDDRMCLERLDNRLKKKKNNNNN